MTWSIPYRLDPGVSYFQDLTWSSLADWTLRQFGLFREMCMTWSILDPGVSYFQNLTWSSLGRLDPGVSLVYSERYA
jgi:hypothetical protein